MLGKVQETVTKLKNRYFKVPKYCIWLSTEIEYFIFINFLLCKTGNLKDLNKICTFKRKKKIKISELNT